MPYAKIIIAALGDSEVHVAVIAETGSGVIGEIVKSSLTLFPEGEIMHFIQTEQVIIHLCTGLTDI